MNDTPNPFQGLPDMLQPNPPADIPAPQAAGDAMAAASPFSGPIDTDQIIKNLTLDRPLKLFIPRAIMERFSTVEFRIINSIPHEIADATNKGFREVTDPEASALFAGLVAGTDKTGQAYRPLLYGRPKAVGENVRRQQRKQLASLYAGMDPTNKELGGKYTENVKTGQDASRGQFSGAAFRIRTG